jgi:enoyl-CoA hydratase/carnithine racemase
MPAVGERNVPASIGLPEIRFGALPAGGGTQRLPRLVGAGVAKEMIFNGLQWTPEEAFRVGLVNRAVPADALIKECETIAGRCSSSVTGDWPPFPSWCAGWRLLELARFI